jgi:hypothetical protein
MFCETITAPREEWERWTERLRITSEPPDALIASIAWLGKDGQVTSANVWDSPQAVGDFYLERVGPIVQSEGEPLNKPERHGEPLAVYVRR